MKGLASLRSYNMVWNNYFYMLELIILVYNLSYLTSGHLEVYIYYLHECKFTCSFLQP